MRIISKGVMETAILVVGICGIASYGAAQTSQWVFVGPDGKLAYKTLPKGDRITDFSSAGYKGGGVALPTATVRQTLSPSGGDDTAAIQAAVDAVSTGSPDTSGFRGAVLLGPGTFNCSGTLNITSSGVVLRGSGSGSGGTIINMTGAPHLAVSIRGAGSWQTVGASAFMTDSYVPSGADSFNVNDASGFSVGDTVLINRPVTQAWVHFMGMDTLTRNGSPQTWIKVGTLIHTDRTIAAISGNRITLDVPLTDSFDASLLNPPGGSIVKYTFSGRISQVGMEHLSITAPAQDVDISMPQFQALTMDAVIDGWVQDVAIHDTDNSVNINGSTKRITLDSVSVAHSIAFTHSAGPSDFSANGTQILLNKVSSIGNTGVWAFVTQALVTGPVVLLDCHADQRGFSPHQRWATGLLADRCSFPGGTASTPGIAYSDRGNFGSGHGWDAGWAVAWNVTSPDFLVQEPPGASNFCIGCVGSEVTAGAPGGPSTLPNGIYDSLGTPVTPSSLYLAQLSDRLGQIVLGPVADAYVRDGASAGTNFGTATILVVKNSSTGFNRRTFLKFDLSAVTSVSSARLRLFGNFGGAAGATLPVLVHSVSNTSWSETAITWNNQPPIGGALASIAVGTTAQYWEWDVTAYIKSQKTAGNNVVTLEVQTDTTGSAVTSFNSREAAANSPQLVINR